MPSPIDPLLAAIRRCELCRAQLPLGPRPVVQASATARLCIIGQAPGRKVHESGIPWDDASGVRLRDWTGLSTETFYDPAKVAIMPMGFCYPGKAVSGDLPPSAVCAPTWHGALLDQLPDVRLTLLIGQYAQARYLGAQRKSSLTETVSAWRDYLPSGYFPLPHPSPRNQPWLARNPWFADGLLPGLRDAVARLEL